MSVADTLNFQDLSTVQSTQQPGPKTIASAATIAPTTFLTILTGNVQVTTITPPQTGLHMIAVKFAGTNGVTTGGNIATAKASVLNEIMLLVYNPLTATYTPVG